MKWLEEDVGGLTRMEELNREKAKLLYDLLDQTNFYRGTAEKESRSLMNVTFRLPSESLRTSFFPKPRAKGSLALEPPLGRRLPRLSLQRCIPRGGAGPRRFYG